MDPVIQFLARILVPLFFIGMAGSAVVIVVSLFLDILEFSSTDE